MSSLGRLCQVNLIQSELFFFLNVKKNILLYLQTLAFDRTCLHTSREVNSDTLEIFGL